MTDEPLPVACPQFSLDETGRLADFLVERVIGEPLEEDRVTGSDELGTTSKLWVNGSPVPLAPFTQRLIAKTLLGFVSALKGVEKVRSLRVSLRVDEST